MKNISELLKEHKLMHFKFYEDPARIIYTYEVGTSSHMYDFSRLIEILKENNIKHKDIGLDIIMIVED
ncbi:MAG: hypothetical protein GQ474_05220 [Sulfurimonas sp.]|nr:hypothetical protein [Sulfurimonas sp.]